MDQLLNSPRANQLLDTPRAVGTKLYLAILFAIVGTVLYCNVYMTRSWQLSGLYRIGTYNDIRDVENVTDEVKHLRQELESLLYYQKQQSNRIRMPQQMRDGKHTKAKIAIMSSFVPNGNIHPPPRLKDEYLKHIINKACYSYIWGYDFIFNTTYGFDDSYPNWHWLQYGTWHRVPHVTSRIRDYDWILYTDTDFLINDIMRPLESFINEWELYNKTNVQLFIPVDNYRASSFTFSAFAFLIRNSTYSHTLLKYWDEFARGICKNGNLNTTSGGKYNWLDTDQPGLWYSMMRTYSDYFPDRVPNDHNYPQCNETMGILNKDYPPWNDYFKNMKGLTKGSTGRELDKVPNDQPYIYSSLPNGQRSGLALQMNWGDLKQIGRHQDGAFALHLKDTHSFPMGVRAELQYCRKNLGCYAHYNDQGELKIGCGDHVYL